MKLKMIIMGIMLTFLMLNMIIVLIVKASPPPIIAQANSTATIYLNPPTINGTIIGKEFTVNLNIRDAPDIQGWQAGLTFNPDLLECTGFFEGEFLSDVGPTLWITPAGKPPFNNTLGVINTHGCTFLGEFYASGDGRLAYATFKVKAPGVSDLHLQDVKLTCWKYFDSTIEKIKIPTNIIDVYTVFVGTTSHTVVTVSNSTGTEVEYGSGFYDHAFSIPAKKISFKVTGPYLGFSNITIPKTLLNVSTLDEWRIAVDGTLLSTEERMITENETHTSIYFMYSAGIHYVQITTRPLIASTISITLSSTFVTLGSDITINGNIEPVRPSATVTILYRCKSSGGVWFSQWTTLTTLTTDSNSHYSYAWALETVGTYEFMVMWEGDDNTFGDVNYARICVFEVLRDNLIFYVAVKSNSTISGFYFNQTLKEIGFNITGLDGTVGFCNVTIPNLLLKPEPLETWKVTIDGAPAFSFNIMEDENCTYLYFTYEHSTRKVEIKVITEKVLLGKGWGWMRIEPTKHVWGRAELYKIGETQIELVITHKGEKYSRTWNIVFYKEHRHVQTYLCYSDEWGYLVVRIYAWRWWHSWSCCGRGVAAFGFAPWSYWRLRVY